MSVFIILQVSYSVTVRYQTTAGQRTFSESYTSSPLLSDHNTFGIPLYNANSTYIVRVTAVTDDGDIITSDDVVISEDEFVDYDHVGQASKSSAYIITISWNAITVYIT